MPLFMEVIISQEPLLLGAVHTYSKRVPAPKELTISLDKTDMVGEETDRSSDWPKVTQHISGSIWNSTQVSAQGTQLGQS